MGARKMKAEFELAHNLPWALEHSTHVLAAEHIKHLEARIALLLGTITGFATNGTNCLACQQSNDCARERLAADDLLAT